MSIQVPQPTKLAVTIALLFVANATTAQTAAPPPPAAEEIVITGTLIRGTNPVGTPVIALGRDEIDKAGATNTVDLLRQLPQIQNLGADEGHINAVQNANQNITVGSGINLRGLGPESTLTLLNGRRLAPGGTGGQYTDPSVIPQMAIERMEVIADGASATYGSDAVGGVVNMRLRKNFEGAETSLKFGAGNGIHGNEFGQLLGKSWSSGNIMLAFNQNDRSRLAADKRSFFTDDMRAFGGPDLRVFNASPGNISTGGVRYAIPTGQNGVGLTTAKFVPATSNPQSIYKGVDALPRQHRTSWLGSLTQTVNSKVSVWAEGFNTNRKFHRELIAATTNAIVSRANPFFATPVSTLNSVTVNYSFLNDLGQGIVDGFERSTQFAGGIDFDVINDWKGSAYISENKTQEKYYQTNTFNAAAVLAALADTNATTALNVFCDGNAFACNNPATIAKIAAFIDRNTIFRISDYGTKFDGPLFSAPGGMARAAVGLGYHKDSLTFYELRNNSSANNTIVAPLGSVGKRTVKSVYAEAYIPLVDTANAMPGIQKLELSLAARSEQYSDFGRTNNPKVGVNWTPMQGVALHATYGKSFRAPTLGDQDEANGSIARTIDLNDANGASVHGIIRLGGNAAGLTPEKATTYTLGLNLKPAMFKGLNVSVDYFNIDYKNRILTPGNDSTLLQRPELAAYVNRNPDPAFIASLIALPIWSGSTAEPVAGIKFIDDGRRFNSGVVKTHGLDISAHYDWDTSIGTLNAGFTGNYIFNYKQQFTPTSALVGALINTLNNPVRFRGRGELGWQQGALRVNAFVNYVNSYTNTTLLTMPKVAALSTLDLSARYDVGDNVPYDMLKGLSITVNGQNVADKNPPYVQNGFLAFDPQNTSAVGRYISVSVNKRW